MKKYFSLLIGLICGVYLATPPFWNGFNRNVFGNPNFETLKKECRTQDPATIIRFYEGSGSLTGAWKSITIQTDAQRERQWLWVYETPNISSIECNSNSVSVLSGTSKEYPVQEIIEKYIKSPSGTYKGDVDSRQWNGSLSFFGYPDITTWIGIVLILVFGVTIVFRKSKAPSNETLP